MHSNDFDEFCNLLDDMAGLMGKPKPAERQAAMFFRSLADHPMHVVRAALDAHLRDPQRGRFFPMPADVLAQINGLIEQHDGRPGAEEAWALVLRGQDEAETIVWTGEMAQAWEIARVVMQAGDEVGARMAFKEAYQRRMDDARRAQQPAAWSVSLGHDPQRRASVVADAVMAGRLPASALLPALPAPSAQPLLALEHATGITEEARAALRRLRDKFSQEHEAPSVDALERARTEELKIAAAAKVAKAQQGE